MTRFKSILVATDTRLDRQSFLHTAAEVAIHNKASLKIVDVVPDLSSAIRLSLQDHEHVQDLLRQEKIQQLESLAVPIRDQGIEVETKLLEGKTPEVVSDFVHDNSVDLVVMGTVARSGLTRLLMGNTSEEVLDQINCSVLAVKPYSFKTPIHA